MSENDTDDRATALRIVDSVRYLVIASADADGLPWASPVYFAADGLSTFWWISRPGSTHSRNIADRSEVALTVFDSTQEVGTGIGVYARATVVEVADADVPAAIATYTRRAEADGVGAWDVARLAAAGLRLYRADADEVSLLPARGPDLRVPVEP